MSDIVERLRYNAPADHGLASGDLMREAAAEIERLRELKTPASRKLLNITKGLLDAAEAEIERLRALVLDAINGLEFHGHPVDASAIRSQLRESAKTVRSDEPKIQPTDSNR